MAYDEALAERLLLQVADDPDIKTRKMFGGYAIMWRGNMLAGVIGDDLMVRVGPDAYEELLADPGAEEMRFTGRPMKGMLTVANESLSEDETLAAWVQRCKDFVGSLPPK